jgi:hypothetical protein
VISLSLIFYQFVSIGIPSSVPRFLGDLFRTKTRRCQSVRRFLYLLY